MALLFGARSSQPNKLGSIQVQTSEKGVVVPYVAGSAKVPVKLLDYVDFKAIKQETGGKGGGGNYNYDYTAALDMLICAGPVGGTGNVYDSGGGGGILPATEYYTIPSGGGPIVVAHHGIAFFNDEGVTWTSPYSFSTADYGSDGTRTLSGTQQVPMAKHGVPGPPAGEYYPELDGGNAGKYFFNPADAGKLVAITYTYTTADTSQTSNRSPLERYAISLIFGTPDQQPWGYMASRHPERALHYPYLARLVSENFDLGSSATPPNLSAEVVNGRLLAYGGGIADCDPAAVIQDICGSLPVGFAWPYVGDLSKYSDFCVANSLLMTVFLDSQRKATEIIQEICDLSNSAPVWSGSSLKIVPYGDTTAVGNGRAYVPDTQPVAEIDESDMIASNGEEPIKASWPGLADNYNSVQFQYLRRDDNYNNDLLNDKDEASILMNGLLPAKTITGDHYKVKAYAAVAMNMLLKRNSVGLRVYKTKLKWWHCRLEPMDIILAKLPNGDRRPVRIVSADEDENYEIDIEAEDFLYGVGNGVLHPKGNGLGSGPGDHDLPGDTTLLAAFEPSVRVTGGLAQLWIATTGGTSWGGCRVWLSIDGASYAPIAVQNGTSRAGILTAPLAAGSDPDTTNTASVSVSGILGSGTQADADAFTTLSLIGSELVSYETATLTAPGAYDLAYLRRGVFAGNSQAHSAGEIFVRLDGSVVKYTLDPTLLGRALRLKFTSFNLYALMEQSLSDVPSYAVNVGGVAAAGNMTVGSYLNSGGTNATVTVYKIGGAPGDAGSATLSNGATITLPAQIYSAEALNTFYAVNFNPVANAYVLYTDRNAWLADQQSGMLGIGSTTTPAAGGSISGAGSYSDLGSSPTANPMEAFSATGGGAEVSSEAFSTSSRPRASSNGICNWFGWTGVTSGTETLSVRAALTVDTDGNTGSSSFGSLRYTLDGSTFVSFFSSTSSVADHVYTATIPAGTDLSKVLVTASCYSTAAAAGNELADSSASIDIIDLHIS